MLKQVLLICFFSVQIMQVMAQDHPVAIVIHGGAGTITPERLSPEAEEAYASVMEEALQVGHAVLAAGGEATDAVLAAIKVMEDADRFNAGRGAVFTSEGTVELDASIMDGKDLNAGAVAGVKTIKNPIEAAFLVLSESPHVMLMGEGAETFAEEHGLEMVENEYFQTEQRREQWKKVQEREEIRLDHNSDTLDQDQEKKDPRGQGSEADNPEWKWGTVGCVALDRNGNLAAGTSTGGMTNKRYGRIGDSPIIGAGTYADNKTCGVSSTGHGEYFIRGVIAYDVSAYMKYTNASLQEAVEYVIHEKLTEMGGDGGVIAMDGEGNIVMDFNTPGMFRGYINMDGDLKILMYQD